MTDALVQVFQRGKAEGRAAFISYVTSGFPTPEDTVPILLELQANGCDIIELGIPFSDPVADGPTIQKANQYVLDHGLCSVEQVLNFVRCARQQGLTIPLILMGYYNTLYIHGEEQMVMSAAHAGVNGFIVVDLPPEESENFRKICKKHAVSYIPLVSPTTSDERINYLSKITDSFIYVVSVTGVTGARTTVSDELPGLLSRMRKHAPHIPFVVGFGVSTKEQFARIATMADGVVVGSAILRLLESKSPHVSAASIVGNFVRELLGDQTSASSPESKKTKHTHLEDNHQVLADIANPLHAHTHLSILPSRFGEFGGKYVSETLFGAVVELEQMYSKLREDPLFVKEFQSFYSYMGRPSPLHLAERMTEECGGAQIWLKREDLNHTGSHKINNALGQILLARRLGKRRIIAETGAGQHGVATATVCAKFNMECVVYMGEVDIKRQALNVFRMQLLGAKVIPVVSGTRTLKDAVNESMRDWVTNVRTSHLVVGSAIGPHPFPTIVRDLQSVIGKETKTQLFEKVGKLPDVLVACVGGGSNSIGIFHPFIEEKEVRLIGVEAGGRGLDTNEHAATLSTGSPGILHGTKTFVLQTADGQIQGTHSISAGLDYPGVGPEHAWLKQTGRAEYVATTDKEALLGVLKLCQLEGIIPALESAHAIYYATKIAGHLPKHQNIVICVSGRGDKDMELLSKALPEYGLVSFLNTTNEQE